MILEHNEAFAAVSAREDVDGRIPTVIYQPDRTAEEPEEQVAIEMSPKEARQLARALNKAAKRLSL